MKPDSTETENAIKSWLNDERTTRIMKRWAKRCHVDWEDLRQTVAAKILTTYTNPQIWWQRADVVCTEIRSCAIDLYRREPDGKLRRLGERARRTNLGCETQASPSSDATRTVCRIDAIEPLDERSIFDGAMSRLDVEDVISCLPMTSRSIAEMYLLDGFSFPEIAVRTGNKLERIKSRWRSGVATLRHFVLKGWA